ncbi:outer membrane lipoprotein chaperone LolA [Chitinibacter sp. SCUT-21]|uniref:outer membrane lipoprotein chaperone LolA n=1 Tax=Chitinibacter sp. SCUT-21 TaxID=2970891 RepID=UPI0035A5ED0D
MSKKSTFHRLLPIFLASILPTAQANSITELQTYLSNTKSLSANFTQSVRQKSGKTENSSGQFQLLRPGQFKWVYAKPYNQEIISNGQQIWLYDVDLAQVTIKPINKALDASPAAVLTGNNNLHQNFNLQSLPSKNGLNWVALNPKNKEASFAQIRIGLLKGQLNMMELDDQFNQTTIIQFDKVAHNQSVARSIFNFIPPKGVDVIRE